MTPEERHEKGIIFKRDEYHFVIGLGYWYIYGYWHFGGEIKRNVHTKEADLQEQITDK